MTVKRILAITFILLCTAVAWFVLGSSLALRTSDTSGTLGRAVGSVWGPPMTQPHPVVYYNAPGQLNGRHAIQPSRSDVQVTLRYEPKKKGLLWYRTYLADFRGSYVIENPTPIAQTIYVRFAFPAAEASYTDFSFLLNGVTSTNDRKTSDGITEAVTLAAGATAQLEVGYRTRGTDQWSYAFGDTTRIRNFQLRMKTNFADIDFPASTGSPTERKAVEQGWQLAWNYPDVIGAQPIGMEMPKVLNPGPVAARISFFAPVSLLFFFTVLMLVATVRGVSLHPMNFFLLAAGCFAFQLLFAYLVDLIPLDVAFFASASVSLVLVSGYLLLVAGAAFARLAAAAQLTYMVLFSYSFFFDGLTGLTIAIGAIVTLALLMAATAKINWAEKFSPAPVRPPPLAGT